jgi:hypothetical protein
MATSNTITTAITLTAQYTNISQYTTVSVSSGPAAITNAFTLGYDPSLTSNGVIIGVGNVNGVLLRPGDNSFATNVVNDGGATIAGNNAIYLSGTLGTNVNDTAATPTSASITNAGIIKGTGATGNQTTGAGILVGTAVHASVNNTNGAPGALGTITGTNYGILFRGLGNFGDYVTNSGSISGGFKGIVFDNITFTNGSSTGDTGFGVVNNSGIIGNATESTGIAVEFDTGIGGASVTNSGTIIGAIQASNGGVLNVQDKTPFGSTITGVANFGSNSTLNLSGTGGIGTAANYIGFSTINVASGANFALSKAGSSATFTGNSIINNSGTVLVGGALVDVNGSMTTAASIDMEATLGIATTIDYTGSVTSTPIYDFGKNDDIILSASALPTEGAGSSDSLAYNTTTGVLTVSETSAAGAVSTAFVTISEPNSFNSSSFVGLQNGNGVNIQLGSSQIIGNTGSLVLNGGETAALSNAALDNVNVTFGPNGSVTAPNVLQLNGANQDITAGFTYGSNTGTVSGFGNNDIISLGTSNIASSPTDYLSVNTSTLASGAVVVQVQDQNAFGNAYKVNPLTEPSNKASENTVTFSSNPGTLVETYGTNGINIETAATDAAQGYTFNASGTADINTIQDYSGSVAPGASIVSGQVVTIASGTATFATTTVLPEGLGGGFTYTTYLQNSGTILVSGPASTFTDSATLTGGGTIVAANGGTINVLDTSGGTDAAQTLKFGATSSSALNTIDLNPTSGTFAGTIAGFGGSDAIVLGPKVLPTAAAGSFFNDSFNTATGVLTVTELSSANSIIGTATVTLAGVSSLTSASFVVTQGPNGAQIELGSSPISASAGSIALDYGKQVTLTNSALDTAPVTFGTHGSLAGPNVLDLNGTSQAVPGTSYYGSEIGPVSGFGTNDIITLGTNAINALPTDFLTTNYDSATGAYQIFDQTAYQRSPNFATSTDVVYFSPPGSYSASSFVETYGTNGINIETAATDAGQGYTFNASGTADINTIQDYSAKVAPGSSIVTGEVVTIASGTATFASANTVPLSNGQAGTFASTFVNSGTILVSGTTSAFTDYSTLTGGGTIVAANGGQVNVLDTSGGTDAAQTLLFGTGGTSLALNTIDLNGTSGTFAGTIAGFGLNDDIVIGPSLLPGDTSFGSSINNYVTLAYAGSLLTVGEVQYGAGGTGTPTTLYTTLNVGTGYSVGSFVALYGTNGINIETAATVLEKPFTLVATPGTQFVEFTDPNQYVGGLAPGDMVIAGESIVINAGSATVEIQNPVANSGNIVVNSGTLLNNGNALGASDLTGTGTITIQNGGKFAQSVSGGTNTIAFGGDTTSNYNVLAVGLSATSFTSPITGFGSNDEILLAAPMLPSPGTASSYTDTYNTATGALVINEFNGSGSLVGTTTLTVANTGSLNSSSFVEVSGYSSVVNMPVVDVLLGSSTLLSTTGSIYIDNGHSVTLSNTSGVDTIPATFGTHGSVGGFNTLDINGTVAGTNSPYQGTISGFGLNDDIIIGPSTLPSLATGSSVTLSYAGSLLTVGEVNSAGSVTASTTIDVGTGYSTSSFVALLGTNGINIETPATVDEQSFTFQSAYNSTGNINQLAGNFEDPTLYKGGLAPGSSIVAGETVTVLPTSLAQLTTPLNNSGVIILNGSGANLVDNAPLSGNGTILVTGGADFVDSSPTGVTTNTIAFGPTVSGVTNIAYLDTPGTAGFAGVIANFGPGDNIDLGSAFLPTPTSASNISLSFNGGILSIFDTVNGTVYTDMLTISGTVPGTFSAALGTMPDGSTGIVLSDVPCFAAGSRILTSHGQVAVEDIKVGDKVLTFRDGAEAEVIWVGHRTIDLARHAMPEKVRPIRILAGAFGEGLPERDLRLSPDHALFIDGHLIEAKTLVNGVTVIEEMATRFVTYHHVELANHDIMLAEGLAAESYLDSGNRVMFESDAAPMMLHPDFAAVSRAKACAPLVTDGDVVVAARARLLERAVALGFTATGDVDLTVKVAGSIVAPDMMGEELLFVLPSGASHVELVSSVGVPAETSAAPGDRRVLGVAVTGLALVVGGKRIDIALDDPAHSGFYAMEDGHRWTNGAATIALPAYTGRAVLEVTINGQAERWVSAA